MPRVDLDTGAAVVQREQEMEDSVEQSAATGFLMVERGSLKDTMKTDCSDL